MNSKILLAAVNAKYIHSNPGVHSLKKYCEQIDKEVAACVDIAEYTINQSLGSILEDLYQRKPDMLGISCYIWNIETIGKLLPEIKKILPDTKIWLGGPEVTYNPAEVMEKYPMLTGIFLGEGEGAFLQVAKYYVKKEGSLEEIKSIFYQGRSIGIQALSTLDELPFLYENLEDFENKIIYYETSRGCPYRCTYCLSSIDQMVRLRSMELVEKELQFFLDHKVPQVKFVDRTFNCNHKHALAIWKYIKEHDNGVTNFHFEVAADIMSEEELELLVSMRPGAVQLEIGVQSTNLETIKEIRRVMDIDKVARVVKRIHDAGNIHAHLDLIAGLPYENYETFGRSFDDVYRMKPEQLQLGFLKVLKGSYMNEAVKEYGIVYTDQPPYEVLYTKWLSFGDILKLKQIEEMVELYYNSNQYTHILPVLLNSFERPFEMFERLAEFYEEKGYFIKQPSRMYRYNVLLAFALLVAPEKEDLWKELFTYDAYLRENLKARPDFAKDFSEHKEKLREYGNANKGNHIDVFTYPIWEMGQQDDTDCLVKRNEPVFVCFHYENRSPLTHEASLEVL